MRTLGCSVPLAGHPRKAGHTFLLLSHILDQKSPGSSPGGAIANRRRRRELGADGGLVLRLGHVRVTPLMTVAMTV